MKNTVFPHKFWRPFLDCMPQLFFRPQYVWFPVHLKGHLIPLCYETLVVNWQNWLFTLFHQSRSVLSPNPIELGAGWWYYRFQFGHGTPLYLSICVSICIHAHAGPNNSVTSHECHGVSNHRWLKSLSERNQPVTGGFPTQRGSVAEIWCFLWKFDVSPNKLPIKHKRDQTQERQVNWHTHFDGLV